MTDTEREIRNLLAEALDVRVPHVVENSLWRVKAKRALFRGGDVHKVVNNTGDERAAETQRDTNFPI